MDILKYVERGFCSQQGVQHEYDQAGYTDKITVLMKAHLLYNGIAIVLDS